MRVQITDSPVECDASSGKQGKILSCRDVTKAAANINYHIRYKGPAYECNLQCPPRVGGFSNETLYVNPTNSHTGNHLCRFHITRCTTTASITIYYGTSSSDTLQIPKGQTGWIWHAVYGGSVTRIAIPSTVYADKIQIIGGLETSGTDLNSATISSNYAKGSISPGHYIVGGLSPLGLALYQMQSAVATLDRPILNWYSNSYPARQTSSTYQNIWNTASRACGWNIPIYARGLGVAGYDADPVRFTFLSYCTAGTTYNIMVSCPTGGAVSTGVLLNTTLASTSVTLNVSNGATEEVQLHIKENSAGTAYIYGVRAEIFV